MSLHDIPPSYPMRAIEPPGCDDCAQIGDALFCTMNCSSAVSRIYRAPEDGAVLALCEQWGFGAVMASAARLWRERDPIGAITLGPCAGSPAQVDEHQLRAELLEALEGLVALQDANMESPMYWRRAKAAIAKARGQ